MSSVGHAQDDFANLARYQAHNELRPTMKGYGMMKEMVLKALR